MDNSRSSPSQPPAPAPAPSSAVDESEVVHIYRLPDEVLLLTFAKLNNAKSLCICSLVSKRFAAVVHQSPSIFLAFPSHRRNSPDDRNENLPKKLFNYLSKPFFRKPSAQKFDGVLVQSAVDSLKSFRNVQDLRIELPSFQQDESIIKWHAEFGKDLNLCVILFATSVHQIISTNQQIQNPDSPLTNQVLQSRIASANQCFREATWRQHVLRHAVEHHRHTLTTAEICDSKQKGRVVMRGKQQLMDLLDPEVKLPASGYGKLWHVQVLRLPESGRVLDGVTVVAIRRTEEDEEEHEDVGVKQLMKKGYEEDEEVVLWEVLSYIFENHAPSRSLNINGGRR